MKRPWSTSRKPSPPPPGSRPIKGSKSRPSAPCALQLPELLQATYTALEEMGCRFEVTGPVVPDRLNPAGIPASRAVYTPAIQRRGVRQHINFNMDVSGYPIGEAKEYIRNLARLRYNHITFHSYPCHWTRDRNSHAAVFGDFRRWTTAYNLKPDDLVTGAYFYGGEFLKQNEEGDTVPQPYSLKDEKSLGH